MVFYISMLFTWVTWTESKFLCDVLFLCDLLFFTDRQNKAEGKRQIIFTENKMVYVVIHATESTF